MMKSRRKEKKKKKNQQLIDISTLFSSNSCHLAPRSWKAQQRGGEAGRPVESLVVIVPPPPPRGPAGHTHDLGFLPACLVVVHPLALSPKCQGQCLIHATSHTLGTLTQNTLDGYKSVPLGARVFP